jgi:hypothetical protein
MSRESAWPSPHLLVVPAKRESLARTMKRTQAEYAQAINLAIKRRCGRPSAHLRQSRFYSCPLNGDAVWTVLRYLELNPVRGGTRRHGRGLYVVLRHLSLWPGGSAAVSVADLVAADLDSRTMEQRAGLKYRRTAGGRDSASNAARDAARR